jgi:hypothetical protein
VEAGVLETIGREFLKVWGVAGTTEGAGRAEAYIVDQNHQDIGRALGRPQVSDRRILGVRVFGVVGGQAHVRPIRDRQN